MTRLAEEKARYHLAAYTVKSSIEWDLRFMSPLDKTFKDEIIIAVMCAPLIGLMIPGLREQIVEGFKTLATIDPNAPSIFVYGWAIIFISVFGKRIATGFLMPGRFAKVVQAMGNVQPDVPDAAVEAAQDAVTPSPYYQRQPSENDTQ